MKTISLKVDANLYAWLDQQSKRLGRSKSEITREALEQSRQRKTTQSLHDLMQDVCGSLRSGVKDLATNKKHLKGYGKWKS